MFGSVAVGEQVGADELAPHTGCGSGVEHSEARPFAADRVVELIRRLAAALEPGGTLAVVDAVPTGSLDAQDRAARLYGVHLLTRTGEGQPWPLSAYREWITDAGLVELDHRCVAADSPMSLVTARLPTTAVIPSRP